jgi:hypothetical protein
MSLQTDQTGATRPSLRAMMQERPRRGRADGEPAPDDGVPAHVPAAAHPAGTRPPAPPPATLEEALAVAAALQQLVREAPGAAVQTQANIPPRNALGLLL